MKSGFVLQSSSFICGGRRRYMYNIFPWTPVSIVIAIVVFAAIVFAFSIGIRKEMKPKEDVKK
jgi:hypothetical protein